MSMGVLESLDTGQFDTAFFLTYTLNLRFFEWLVLPRLRRMGVTHIGILVDYTGYAETLRDTRQQSECGRSYTVAPVRLVGGGIQHAKALWLSGKQGHRALVGSHNLTMSGCNDQLELTTDLQSTVPEHAVALRDLHEAISDAVPPLLMDVWSRIPMPPTPAGASGASTRVLTSFREPLEEQLVRHIGAASGLRVVTPFLEASQLERLATRLGATDIVLDVPHEGLDVPLTDATGRMPALRPRTLPTSEKRRLHAKGYEFQTVGMTWSAAGSANCTYAGLARSVGQGGNLEFLVLARDSALPGEIAFETITDPTKYSGTGRAWNEGRTGSALVVTRAEYRSPTLTIAWEVTGHSAASEVEVQIGDQPAHTLDATPATVVLEGLPPSTITLTALIGDEVVEAHAWVINHDALAQFAQRAHTHAWSERIAAGNVQRLATSLDELTKQLLEYGRLDDQLAPVTPPSSRHDTSDSDSADEVSEVFVYSDDADRVRQATERLLTAAQGADPLALSWAFMARIAHVERTLSDTELAEGENVPSPGSGRGDRGAAAQRTVVLGLVASLITHLRARATLWQRVAPNVAESVPLIRVMAGWVTIIGMEVRRNTELASKGAQLVETYMSVVQAIPSDALLSLDLEARGPLALSLAVLGDMAGSDQGYLRNRYAQMLRRIEGDDPRAILSRWRAQYSQQAHSLLRDPNNCGDRFELLAGLSEQLIGKVSSALHLLLHQKWGLLAALQESDMNRLPTRDALYAQAEVTYHGTRVWDRYVVARQRGALPILLRARNRRCPICGLTLSNVEERLLDEGHALMSCKHIIVLDY